MGDALLAGVSLRYTPACALATPSGFVFSPATYYRTGINPEGVERPQAGVKCNGTPAFRRTVSSGTPKGWRDHRQGWNVMEPLRFVEPFRQEPRRGGEITGRGGM